MTDHHPTAKKALGQHFLKDRRAIESIAAAATAGSRMLEIGPGPGAITELLLQRAAALAVIEKDDRFAAQWQQVAASDPRLQVFHGDVMQLLMPAVEQFQPQWIVGNLPYNISGPLTAMLASLELSGGMVLMYQREVADRIAAEPGSKTYGGLSVLVQHHYRCKRLLVLPPGAFAPPPKVHSAVITLTPHGLTPPCSFAALQSAVRQGFAHRRKTIANNFRGKIDSEGFVTLAIEPGNRPEQLDYAAWTRIARFLEDHRSS